MRSEVNNFPCYRSASYAWSRRRKYNSHLQKFKVQTLHHPRNLESQWHIRNKRANVRAIYIDYPFANPTNLSATQLFSCKSNAVSLHRPLVISKNPSVKSLPNRNSKARNFDSQSFESLDFSAFCGFVLRKSKFRFQIVQVSRALNREERGRNGSFRRIAFRFKDSSLIPERIEEIKRENELKSLDPYGYWVDFFGTRPRRRGEGFGAHICVLELEIARGFISFIDMKKSLMREGVWQCGVVVIFARILVSRLRKSSGDSKSRIRRQSPKKERREMRN